ncbi:MAG: SDR family NAD(P)-dependent oxidoreductase [Gemmatimonadetes bacterium]|nr:SDR family NAD(P)-dependent oxidoreductase [Gemmatimonadota bacterium]
MTSPVAAASAPAGVTRSVVITGVARVGQLGDALARSLASDGTRIAIVARKLGDATSRAAEMRADGFDVHPFGCDLSDPAATLVLAQAVMYEFGRVDALVNAAGGFAFSGPVAAADPALLSGQFATNVSTALNATRAFLPALRESRGAIVFVSSAAALPGSRVRHVSAYAMAKTAVLTLMRAVAQEERENGVRSNAIAPGAIRTGTNLSSMPATTRYVEPEVVASAVRFLCSPASEGVTGQVVGLVP